MLARITVTALFILIFGWMQLQAQPGCVGPHCIRQKNQNPPAVQFNPMGRGLGPQNANPPAMQVTPMGTPPQVGMGTPPQMGMPQMGYPPPPYGGGYNPPSMGGQTFPQYPPSGYPTVQYQNQPPPPLPSYCVTPAGACQTEMPSGYQCQCFDNWNNAYFGVVQ